MGEATSIEEEGVPFLFKQWGEWHPQASWYGGERQAIVAHSGEWFECPAFKSEVDIEAWRVDVERFQRAAKSYNPGYRMFRVGKKDAGRELDGVVHDAFPKGGVK